MYEDRIACIANIASVAIDCDRIVVRFVVESPVYFNLKNHSTNVHTTNHSTFYLINHTGADDSPHHSLPLISTLLVLFGQKQPIPCSCTHTIQIIPKNTQKIPAKMQTNINCINNLIKEKRKQTSNQKILQKTLLSRHTKKTERSC